ncbi:hypothetical protein L596_027806 [Steinernema carpocapsae]|uniref:Uncharacterized protein n=1 Tax=Steinernema carpocapsae TaxID=34508 RepID=A0A4U5LWL4_STECR|nr:hypothetical protein L596_027806 [Steinernema carpocapsae]
MIIQSLRNLLKISLRHLLRNPTPSLYIVFVSHLVFFFLFRVHNNLVNPLLYRARFFDDLSVVRAAHTLMPSGDCFPLLEMTQKKEYHRVRPICEAPRAYPSDLFSDL